MPIKISNLTVANKLYYNVNSAFNRLVELNQDISSGKKLQKPSDDPILSAKAVRLRTQVDRMNQYIANIDEGLEYLGLYDTYLQDAAAAVKRARDLSLKQPSLLTPDQRMAVAEEIDQLIEELVRIGNAKHRGKYIFGGHQTDSTAFRVVRSVPPEVTGNPLSPNNNVGRITGVYYDGDFGEIFREVQENSREVINRIGGLIFNSSGHRITMGSDIVTDSASSLAANGLPANQTGSFTIRVSQDGGPSTSPVYTVNYDTNAMSLQDIADIINRQRIVSATNNLALASTTGGAFDISTLNANGNEINRTTVAYNIGDTLANIQAAIAGAGIGNISAVIDANNYLVITSTDGSAIKIDNVSGDLRDVFGLISIDILVSGRVVGDGSGGGIDRLVIESTDPSGYEQLYLDDVSGTLLRDIGIISPGREKTMKDNGFIVTRPDLALDDPVNFNGALGNLLTAATGGTTGVITVNGVNINFDVTAAAAAPPPPVGSAGNPAGSLNDIASAINNVKGVRAGVIFDGVGYRLSISQDDPNIPLEITGDAAGRLLLGYRGLNLESSNLPNNLASKFQALIDLRDDLLANTSGALTAIEFSQKYLDDLHGGIMAAVTDIGGQVNSFGRKKSDMISARDYTTDLLSKMEDTNVAEAISLYRVMEQIYSAASQVGARLIQRTLLDFLR